VPFLQSAIGKRWATKFPGEPHCHSKRSLDGNPRNSPNPTEGTGKSISYLTLQHERYISFLNNSSLSDFLTVTISPFRKVLILTEAEVVKQIEEVQEVEMEVEEEVDSLAAVTTARKDIRALLDRGCLVGDCISKQVVDSLCGLIPYRYVRYLYCTVTYATLSPLLVHPRGLALQLDDTTNS
jgi:hypothetical protein